MGGAVATPLPVQGVPPGLTAEPLAGQEPEIQGVPAGLTAEPVKPAAGSQQPMAGPASQPAQNVQNVQNVPKPAPPNAPVNPVTAWHGMNEGRNEGWMPQNRPEQLGSNPVFRPGDQPALYQPSQIPTPPPAPAGLTAEPVTHPATAPEAQPQPPAPTPPIRKVPEAPVTASSLSPTMAEPSPKGLVEPGNLPIWNRPRVNNADGTYSSEYSVSFQDDKGREVLVPTVVGGKFLTPDGTKPERNSPAEKQMFKAAWQHYLKTGENLGKFDSPANADAYANILHSRGEAPTPHNAVVAAGDRQPIAPEPQGIFGRAWGWARGLPVGPGSTETFGALIDDAARSGHESVEHIKSRLAEADKDLDRLPRILGDVKSGRWGDQPLTPGQQAEYAADQAAVKAGSKVAPGQPNPRHLPMVNEQLWNWSEMNRENAAMRKDNPNLAAALDAIQDKTSQMTRLDQLAVMAALPENKLLSVLFGANAGIGAYGGAKSAAQKAGNGDTKGAVYDATGALLDATIASLASAHAVGARGYTGAYGERGVRVGGGPVQAEAGYRPAYREPGPGGAYDETSRVVPGGPTLRAKVGPVSVNLGGVKEAPAVRAAPVEMPAQRPQLGAGEPVPRGTEGPETGAAPLPIGEVEPETARPVLQEGNTAPEIQKAATEEHPAVRKALDEVASGIQGAAVVGARPEKDAERLDEKIAEEGQSPQTARDYSGFRIAVDSPAAADRVAQALKSRFEVHGEQDNFAHGDDDYGFHARTMNVREPGSDVTHEVQILPREVAEKADEQHGLYEKAREGDQQAAADLRERNAANYASFLERQGTGDVERGAEAAGAQARPGARAGAETPVRGGQPPARGQAGLIPTADIHFAPQRFQYKLNTNAAGVTNLLKGQKWNPDLGLTNPIMVWRDPADQKFYVVDGHHRLQLAIENRVPEMNVVHIPAANEQEARTTAALNNISLGRGTAVDAAKFFRATGTTVEHLKEKGISLGEATAANGMALSHLNPLLFDKVVNGQLRIGRGIAIGNATDSPEQQEAIVKLIQRHEMRDKRVSDDTIDELARMAKMAGEHAETQQSLFGEVEMRRNLALEKAEISAYIREELGKEKRLFGTVAEKGRAERLEAGGNRIDVEKNAETAQAAAEAQQVYDRLSTRTGPVDDVLNRAARELAEGKGNANDIKRRAYNDARAALAQAYHGGEGAGAPGGAALPAGRETPGSGNTPAAAQQTAVRGTAPAGNVDRVAKGEVVRLKDGRAGVVQYLTPAGIEPARARVRLSDGTMRENVKPADMTRVEAAQVKPDSEWIGVDLDKTLAYDDGFKGQEVIGQPVPAMLERVRNWLAEGRDVRIVTARVSEDPGGKAKAAIEAWLTQHLGKPLPITDVKDAHMERLWDDRAVAVKPNTGEPIGGEPNAANGETRTAQAAVEPVAEQRKNVENAARGSEQGGLPEDVPGRVAERPVAGTAAGAEVRPAAPGGPAGAEPARPAERLPGETPAETQARLIARGKFQKELSAAESRKPWENAGKMELQRPVLHGSPTVAMNAAAYEAVRSIVFPDDYFSGAFMDSRNASHMVGRLRSFESDLRQRGLKTGAEAVKNLALALDGAREPDGGLLLLRGDYDAPTLREELWHRWQNRNGLRQSEAMQEIAAQPVFERAMGMLHGIYAEISPEDAASEIVAKALAGDPDIEWRGTEQGDLARMALEAAVEEKGPAILDEMPPADPLLGEIIEKAREHGKQIRGGARPEGRGVAEANRSGVQKEAEPERNASAAPQRPESAGAGVQRGAEGGAPSQTELEEGERRPSKADLEAAGQGGLFRRSDEDISPERAFNLFKEKAARLGIRTSGAFLPYSSNYLKIDENLPAQTSPRGYPVEATIRFSDHDQAGFRPTFEGWQGGSRAQFDAWSDRVLGDLANIKKGDLEAFERAKLDRVIAANQAVADYWRQHGNEQTALRIERDVAKMKKSQSAAAVGAQAPEKEATKRDSATVASPEGISQEPLLRRKPEPLRPEDSLALPGMENADEERRAAEAQTNRQAMEERMRQPLGNVERAAGEMERNAPLFEGTGANPQGSLFRRERRLAMHDWFERMVELRGQHRADQLAELRGKPPVPFNAETWEPPEITNSDEVRQLGTTRDSLQRQAEFEDWARKKGVEIPPFPSQGTLFRREQEPAPQWFLKSDKLIDRKMQGPMPADAVLRMLENNGVKPEEMKWSGLGDMLKEKGKSPVKPDELKKFLAANSLQIEEVEKGPGPVFRQSFPTEAALRQTIGADEMLTHNGELWPGLTVRRTAAGWNLFDSADRGEDRTKFSDRRLSLPGGRNYRELLVTLPQVGLRFGPGRSVERTQGAFVGSHWQEPNVVGHVRFNDRTGPNGEKLLHLEELQSDWHEKGRDRGYGTAKAEPNTGEHAEARPWRVGETLFASKQNAEDFAREQSHAMLPDAPFKKTWPELLLKRMIRYAAENGYDGISWTPGDEQAERYKGLQQVADKLQYDPAAKHLHVYKSGHLVKTVPAEPRELPGMIGKAPAQRLLDSPTVERKDARDDVRPEFPPEQVAEWNDLPALRLAPGNNINLVDKTHAGQPGVPVHQIEGDDLKLGGEGMRKFYDDVPDKSSLNVVTAANKLGRPFGAKVGEISIGTRSGADEPKESEWEDVPKSDLPEGFVAGRIWRYETENGYTNAVGVFESENGDFWAYKDGEALVSEASEPAAMSHAIEAAKEDAVGDSSQLSVPYLPVTEAMRKSAMQEGQPLFKKQRTGMPAPGTTVTTGGHDTGRSLEEAIDDLKAMPTRKVPVSEKVELAADAGLRAVAETGTALQKTFGAIKGAAAGAWDSWNQPAPWSDYLENLGDLRKGELTAAMDLERYQKELRRVAPNEREREAITVFGEAKSDIELRRWAQDAKQWATIRDKGTEADKPTVNAFKKYAQAFEDALKLTPAQRAVAEAHRKYYDSQLKILIDAGLLPAGASHYAMHMFATDPEALSQLRAVTDFAELAPNPSFLKRRVYKSFFEAMEHGELPKTMDAGRILSAYHDAFTKTFMTRGFIRSLIHGVAPEDGRPLAILESRAGWQIVDTDKQGNTERILRQPKRPESADDYVRIPASQLRNFTWEPTEADKEMLAPGYAKMDAAEQAKLFGPDDPRFPVPEGKSLSMKGDVLIHPKYAARVRDLVTRSWFDTESDHLPARVFKTGLKATGKVGSTMKSVILYGSGFHQVQLGMHALDHFINPFKLADLKTLAVDPVVQDGVGHGLKLIDVDPEGVLSHLPGMGSYHRYLFRDWIPRLKAHSYKIIFGRNLEKFGGGKAGSQPKMTRDEIALMSAQQTNAAFSGLDPAFFRHLNFMANRTYRAGEHLLLFSPDFTKARMQFVAQGFSKFGTEQRLALLRGAVIMAATARIVNYALNRDRGWRGAHWAPEDLFTVVTPKSWGPAWGGKAIGMRTVYGDIAKLIESPKEWGYNRLNPVTLRPTIEFITGRDNFGRQETKGHFFEQYGKQMAPIPVQKVFTTSDQTLLDSFFTSLGANMATYRTPLEKYAHNLRIQGIPDEPESEDKENEQRRNIQLVEKLRDGRATQTDLWNLVSQGKLAPREAAAINERANMTDLQYDLLHMQNFDDATKVWEKADAEERRELAGAMQAKSQRQLQDVGRVNQPAAQDLEAKLKKLGVDIE